MGPKKILVLGATSGIAEATCRIWATQGAALFLVAPQPGNALGAELIALAAASGVVLNVLDRRGGHDDTSRVARYIERASPNAVTSVLFGVAGITFLLPAGGGLYWLIPAVVSSLAGGVINAWLFLVRV